MKNFINKIISDTIKYNKALGIIVMIIGMLLIGFNILIFNKREYLSDFGKVEDIKMGYYLTERTSRFKVRKEFIDREGLEITLNNKLFYVDDNEKDKWDEIFQKVKIGDNIHVIYRYFSDNNMNNIYGLNTKNENILSVEERNRPMKYILTFMSILLIIAILSMLTLIKKRISYNRKR